MELLLAVVAIDVAVFGYLLLRSLHRIEDELHDAAYRLPYEGPEGIAEHAEKHRRGDSSDGQPPV